MRSRFPFLALLLVVGALTLPHLAHAAIPFFGPIVPDVQGTSYGTCPAAWPLVIMVVNNIIEFLLTLVIVFITPIMVAYSGFLLVVNQGNASKVSEAKSILTNTVLGIVIALSAWMIVDAVMSVLYTPPAGSSWNTWTTLISSGTGDICLPQAGALEGQGLNQATSVTSSAASGGTLSTSLSTVPGSPCNPATITAAASGVSTANANLLACIAQGESTCGTKNPPYNLNYSWNKAGPTGKASSAAGAYQVLLSSNHTCYENAMCYAAAGVGSSPLNCQNAFDSNGFPISGTTLTNCQKAAGNIQCSAAAAACLLGTQSFSSAYGTDSYLASCQSQYGG